MAAAIVDKNGNRMPLWIRLKEDGKPSAQGVDFLESNGVHSFPFVEEIQVENQLAEVPIIRATLAPPYKEGIAFLESPLVEWGESVLDVQLGYVAGGQFAAQLSPQFRGIILKPDIQIGPIVNIVMHAQGVGGFSLMRQYQDPNAILAGKTRQQIIQAVADRQQFTGDNALVVKFDPGLLDASTAAGKLMQEPQADYRQGNKTDFQVIWQMVQEANSWFSVVGNTMTVFPRNGALKANPKYVLALYELGEGGAIGMNAKPNPIYPILGASSPTMGVYLPGGATFGFKLRGFNGQTGEFQEVVTDRTKVEGLGSGKADTPPQNLYNPKGSQKPFYADIATPEQQQRVQSLAQQEYEKVRTAIGVNLEIDTIGIPEIRPGDIVNVRGLGRRISGAKNGNYGVFKVTHTMSGGGLTTSLELISNVAPLKDLAAGQALSINTSDAKNTSSVEPSAAYT